VSDTVLVTSSEGVATITLNRPDALNSFTVELKEALLEAFAQVAADPAARAVVDRTESASRSRNNPWHGRELPDPVVATVWAGRITYRR